VWDTENAEDTDWIGSSLRYSEFAVNGLVMNLPTIDILKAAAEWSMITTLTLGWIHLSKQKAVSQSFGNSLAITARLAVVFVASFSVLCVWLGLPVDWFLGIFAVIFVLCPLTTVDLIRAADEVGFVVSLVLFLPIYSLKQFILGFPDREILMPIPEPFNSTSVDLAGLRGAVGRVTVTLRPYGKVEVGGTECAATSVGGQMVERGASVRVSDIRNSVLVVAEPHSLFCTRSSV